MTDTGPSSLWTGDFSLPFPHREARGTAPESDVACHAISLFSRSWASEEPPRNGYLCDSCLTVVSWADLLRPNGTGPFPITPRPARHFATTAVGKSRCVTPTGGQRQNVFVGDFPCSNLIPHLGLRQAHFPGTLEKTRLLLLMASLSFSHTRVFFSQLLSLLLYLDPSSTFHSASEGLARMFRPHTALEGAARGGVIPRFAFSIPPASRKQRHRLYIQYPPNGKGSRIRHGCLRAGHLCSPLVSQSAYPRHTGKTATGSSKSRIDSKRGSYDSPTASGQSQVQEWRCACGGQLAPGGRRRSWPSRR